MSDLELLAGLNAGSSATATIDTGAGDAETISLNDLLEVAVDNAAVAEAQAKMLDPAGTYFVYPTQEHQPTIRVKRGDDGRITVSYFAIGQLKDGRKGKVSTFLSPELKDKLNDRTGQMEPDYKSKRWVEAVGAFKSVRQEAPANAAEVVEFLATSPLSFRVIQMGVPTKGNPDPTGEPGTLVVAIGAVRG